MTGQARQEDGGIGIGGIGLMAALGGMGHWHHMAGEHWAGIGGMGHWHHMAGEATIIDQRR